MKNVEVQLVKAFTQNPAEGKPGKIFIDATDKIQVGGYAVSFGNTTIPILPIIR